MVKQRGGEGGWGEFLLSRGRCQNLLFPRVPSSRRSGAGDTERVVTWICEERDAWKRLREREREHSFEGVRVVPDDTACCPYYLEVDEQRGVNAATVA